MPINCCAATIASPGSILNSDCMTKKTLSVLFSVLLAQVSYGSVNLDGLFPGDGRPAQPPTLYIAVGEPNARMAVADKVNTAGPASIIQTLTFIEYTPQFYYCFTGRYFDILIEQQERYDILCER